MNNNDFIIRLRYALNLSDGAILQIFKLGGYDARDRLSVIMTKKQDQDAPETPLDNRQLEQFLNGLIIDRRGDNGTPATFLLDSESANNVAIKKIKIALSLTTDAMIEIFKLAGFNVSKSEISAILRQKDHRNYKPAGDQFTRNFLKGLAVYQNKRA